MMGIVHYRPELRSDGFGPDKAVLNARIWAIARFPARLVASTTVKPQEKSSASALWQCGGLAAGSHARGVAWRTSGTPQQQVMDDSREATRLHRSTASSSASFPRPRRDRRPRPGEPNYFPGDAAAGVAQAKYPLPCLRRMHRSSLLSDGARYDRTMWACASSAAPAKRLRPTRPNPKCRAIGCIMRGDSVGNTETLCRKRRARLLVALPNRETPQGASARGIKSESYPAHTAL